MYRSIKKPDRNHKVIIMMFTENYLFIKIQFTIKGGLMYSYYRYVVTVVKYKAGGTWEEAICKHC